MLSKINEKAISSHNPHEIDTLNHQFNAIDDQIDQLVYQLYGLTDKEIRIIEESIDSVSI
jgi:hypothetical protein